MKIYESIILACSYRTATGLCKLTVHLFSFQTCNFCSSWDWAPSWAQGAFLWGTWSRPGIPYSFKAQVMACLGRLWVAYGLLNDRLLENKVEVGACHPTSKSPNLRRLLTTWLTLLFSIHLHILPSQSHGNSVSTSRPAQKHVTQCKSELRSSKSLFSSLATLHTISVCSVQITSKFLNLLARLKRPDIAKLIIWVWLQKKHHSE